MQKTDRLETKDSVEVQGTKSRLRRGWIWIKDLLIALMVGGVICKSSVWPAGAWPKRVRECLESGRNQGHWVPGWSDHKSQGSVRPNCTYITHTYNHWSSCYNLLYSPTELQCRWRCWPRSTCRRTKLREVDVEVPDDRSWPTGAAADDS